MNRMTLNLEQLRVDSFETEPRVQETGPAPGPRRAWSDDSVCPTTNPSDRRFCY